MKTKILIPLLMLACLLAMSATAQVNYAFSEGTAYVTRSPFASGDVVIASTYNGYPVTSITDYAFYHCTNLTSASIPNSVTLIENYAFSDCTALTHVMIPDSVTSIWGGAFFGCTSLTSVTIPDSVNSIGYQAFVGCSSLTNLAVGVGNSVFSGLDGVLFDKGQTTLITFLAGRGGSYVIPDSVTSIQGDAFIGCTSLTSVTILNSVTHIGGQAFGGCTGLTNVLLSSGVTNIESRVFSGCTSLVDISIPESVASIYDQAFSGCTALTNLCIPDSVTYIGFSAFDRCTNLLSASVGNGVSRIRSGTFGGCSRLKSVTLGTSVQSIDGPTMVDFGPTIPGAFAGCTDLTSISFPASLSGIGFGAFQGCRSLTNLTFQGNAPRSGLGLDHPAVGATVYYYCGTTGWGPTYDGLPTVMLAALPRISLGSDGVTFIDFHFTLTCFTNQTIVVEASTNLVNWQPIWTVTVRRSRLTPRAASVAGWPGETKFI